MSVPLPSAPRDASAAAAIVASAAAPPTTRIDFIDAARAIGILMVIVGHLPEPGRALDLLLFSMHVPLFFWLSGWLLDPAPDARPVAATLERTLRRLVVPYAVFFVLSWLYWLATRGIGGRSIDYSDVTWYEPWIGFALGIGPAMVVNPTLWFFPCLATTVVAFALLERLAMRAGAGRLATVASVAAFAAAVLLTAPPPVFARWPWGLDVMPAALLMYASGHACRLAWPRLSPWLRRSGAMTSVAWGGLAAAWAWAALAREQVDLQFLEYGGTPAGFAMVAAAGIAVVVGLAHRMPVGRVVRWLSDNTLILFPTHVLLFSLFSGVAKLGLGLGAEDLHSGWAQLAKLAATLVLSVPVVWVCRRLLAAIDARLPRRRSA